MPLTTTIETPQQLAKTLEKELEATGSSSFAVIYASHVDGQSWCGDCRAAEPIVEKKFRGKYGEKIWVVYAGDKVEYVFSSFFLLLCVLFLGWWRFECISLPTFGYCCMIGC